MKDPYSVLGVSKNATEEEISRWCTLFNSHGADVRVSE